MLVALLAVVAGAAILAVAADQFVVGAARVALLRRMSPLVVGVVIIGFGTSSPELLVSASAAVGGDGAIAVGNVVGSNIANLTLLLGIGAAIVPLVVASSTVRREAPLVVVAVAAFAVVVFDGDVGVVEGVVLLVGLAGAIGWITRGSSSDPIAAEAVEFGDARAHRFDVEVARTLVGLAATIGAAQLLLWGAVDAADRLGLGAGFVGATLVAVGTSLPELVTVVQSARRAETDLVVGNLLGSNLFNALGVGGVMGVIGVEGIDGAAVTSVGPLVAVGVAGIAWVAMASGRRVARLEGILLVVAYAAIVPVLT